MHLTMKYTIGEWIHAGFAYYNGASYLFKNGCLVMIRRTWFDNGWSVTTPDEILFGQEISDTSEIGDIKLDLLLDEVYLWEAKKSARVAWALYHQEA